MEEDLYNYLFHEINSDLMRKLNFSNKYVSK